MQFLTTYLEYYCYKDRLASFQNWPPPSPNAEAVALAGFHATLPN